jgi:hypothetical protein
MDVELCVRVLGPPRGRFVSTPLLTSHAWGLSVACRYDIWFGTTATGAPASAASSYEIMIWLSGEGGCVPALPPAVIVTIPDMCGQDPARRLADPDGHPARRVHVDALVRPELKLACVLVRCREREHQQLQRRPECVLQ